MRATEDAVGHHDGPGSMPLDERDNRRDPRRLVSDVTVGREPSLELGRLSPFGGDDADRDLGGASIGRTVKCRRRQSGV
jgi:hypothetical protein